jgi:hypothetical protein
MQYGTRQDELISARHERPPNMVQIDTTNNYCVEGVWNRKDDFALVVDTAMTLPAQAPRGSMVELRCTVGNRGWYSRWRVVRGLKGCGLGNLRRVGPGGMD